jgi:hypothetical protein
MSFPRKKKILFVLFIGLGGFVFWGWRYFLDNPVIEPIQDTKVSDLNIGTAEKEISKNNGVIDGNTTTPRFRRAGWDGKNITQKKVATPNPKEPKLSELIDPERKGEVLQFVQGSQRFVSLPGIEAVEQSVLMEDEKDDSLGDFFNYSLFRREPNQKFTEGFPMVYQADQGALAVVTGNLKVKYDPETDLSAPLAAKYGMDALNYFPEISLSFFVTKKRSVSELLQLAGLIRREPGVREVNLDLIDRLPSVQ